MSRKNEILNAVIETLKTKSFTGDFTLSSVAKEANIGKSTIYEYFSNKDQLLKAALFKFVESTIEDVTIDLNVDELSFEELFKTQMKKLLETANSARILIDSFRPRFQESFSEESRIEMKEVMLKVRKQIEERFASYFQKGMQEGILQPQQTIENMFTIPSMTIGSIIMYTDPMSKTNIDVIVDSLYKAIIKLCN